MLLLRNKELENNRSQASQSTCAGKGTDMSQMQSQNSELGSCAVRVSAANKQFSFVYTRFLQVTPFGVSRMICCSSVTKGVKWGHLLLGAEFWGRQIEVVVLRNTYEMSDVSGC